MKKADSQSIAILVFRDQVAPRYGVASVAWLIQAEGGVETGREVLDISALYPEQIPEFLSQKGASDIICGGIHPRFESLFGDYKIQLTAGVVGSAEDALSLFLRGEMESLRRLGRAGRGFGGGQGRGQGRGPGKAQGGGNRRRGAGRR